MKNPITPDRIQTWWRRAGLPASIFVVTGGVGLALGGMQHHRAHIEWEDRARRECDQLTGIITTRLTGLERRILTISTVFACSGTISRDEFLTVVDLTETSGSGSLLPNLAFVRTAKDARDEILFSTEKLKLLKPGYTTLPAPAREAMAQAGDRPGHAAISDAFEIDGARHLAITAFARTKDAEGRLISYIPVEPLFADLPRLVIPPGLSLVLRERANSAPLLDTRVAAGESRAGFLIRKEIGLREWAFEWHLADAYSGGPATGSGLLLMTSLPALGALLAWIASQLQRRNADIRERVEERTAELTRANASLEKTVRELDLNRYMLDKATTAIYLIDEHGVLLYANECAAKYAGYTREELTGQHIGLLNRAVTEEKWSARWNKVHALPPGELDVVTMTHHRKDGTTYPIEILAHHITHEGRCYQLSMGVDITGRKAAEENILQTEARLDQALSLTRSGYWSVTLDGSTHYTSSERAAALFGDAPNPEWRYNLADWRARIEAVSPEIAEETGQNFLKACSGEAPFYDATYPYKRPADGRVVWLHNLGVIIRDKPDRPPEMYGVCQDVTEIVEAKRELEAARKAADLANRLKSEFLANMSHEIRTPMNAILGYTQLMRRDPGLAAAQIARVETINRAGEHLLALINDILEMSKIEAGRITINESAFDLHTLLDELVELYSIRARAKGLTLELNRESDFPRFLVTDEGKLRQSLLNLLGNAVKFTKEGGVTLTAHHEPADDGKIALTFVVTDTGPGLAQEEIAKLFRPFVQSAAGVSAGGTGLGLAISRQYSRLLGGDITVKSEPGDGAHFTLTVIAASADAACVVEKAKTPQVLRLSEGHPEVRVLVADDNRMNRELLSAIFEPMGFDIRLAENGAEALEIFQGWKPHAVLMDMRMPVMDGYEANRRIKATPQGRSTFILALTASAFEEDKAAVLASGADAFMRKPFKQDELLAILGEKLGLRYDYADTDVTAVAARTSSSPADISGLPPELLAELRKACDGADYEKLMELCAGMGTLFPEQAAMLRERADAFDYETITRLLAPKN